MPCARTRNFSWVSQDEGRIRLKQAQQNGFWIGGREKPLNLFVVGIGLAWHFLSDLTQAWRLGFEHGFQNDRRFSSIVLGIEERLSKIQKRDRLEHEASSGNLCLAKPSLSGFGGFNRSFQACPNLCPNFRS